jgi:polyribonucleotide 5'-hydroxyl-kinase
VLATSVEHRLDRDQDAKTAGLIVNTNGWVDGGGFDVLLHCIKVLAINVILVMSHDKLYSSLLATMQNIPGSKETVIVKLPRSGGIINRVCMKYLMNIS